MYTGIAMSEDSNRQNHMHSVRSHSNTVSTVWEIINVLLKKKLLIVLYTFFVTALLACIAYYYYTNSPSIKTCVLNFSLTFEGINDGQYPNGNKFVDSDIISTLVLQQVYDNNNLKHYFGGFNNFKNTISVQRHNPGLAFLNFEYKAKLANKNLTSAERYEIEQQFYRQTANMIAQPAFTLVFIFPDAEKYNLPDSLAFKILNDTLTVWLENAKKYQGITKYNISFISNRIDEEFVKNTGYFTSTDLMRLLLKDLNNDIVKLEQIPGSRHIRLKHEDKTFSIQDLKLRLVFIKKYVLEPLLENIRTSGVNKNKQDVMNYIIAQIKNLEIQADTLMRRKDNLEHMLLERYTTSIEPILKINTEEVLLKNEILFYKNFLKSMNSSDKNISSEAGNKIITYQKQLIDAENSLIDLIEKFYGKICIFNLESNATFYKVNSYSSFVYHKLSKKYVEKNVLTVWVVLELLLFLVIVGLYYIRKEGVDYLREEEIAQVREYIQLRSLPARSESLERRLANKKAALPEGSDSIKDR
jgi:hypothetical protein